MDRFNSASSSGAAQADGGDPVLSTLPAALVERLHLSPARRSNISRGRALIAEGQAVDTIYVISEGWAVARLRLDTSDSQILDILGPGSLVGLSRLEGQQNQGFSAIALQEVKAHAIAVSALRNACADDPDLGNWLTDMQSRDAKRAQRHIAALGQLPARGRLAFALLRICDVAGQLGTSAVDTTIRLPMTQEEIGNMLGLTNVSISKLMSAFRKEGMIDYGRNRILVHDVNALSEICGMQLEINAASSEDRQTSDPAYRDRAAR